MHCYLAVALTASACAAAAQAQTRPAAATMDLLTIDRAVDLALADAPGVSAADAGLRTAEAQRRMAGLRPNPIAGIEVENVAGSGGYRGVRSAETTLGLSLPIELGGKRSARIAAADTQAARARLAVFVARADLQLRVTQAFNATIAADRHLLVARDLRDVADEALRVARARVRAGKAAPLEEQRAELFRINEQIAFEQAERNARVARDTLGRLIGRDPGNLDTGGFDQIGGLDRRMTADAAGTLALAIAEADVASAAAQVGMARSQRVPDLTLSAGARRLEATNDVAAVLGISLPIPLFDTGRAGLDAAWAKQDQAEALRRAALFDAQQAIANANADLVNFEAAAHAAVGPALTAAQEAARIVRTGHREGKFGQLDLLEAERILGQTRTAAIGARATYHDAGARLARLTARAPADTDNQP